MLTTDCFVFGRTSFDSSCQNLALVHLIQLIPTKLEICFVIENQNLWQINSEKGSSLQKQNLKRRFFESTAGSLGWYTVVAVIWDILFFVNAATTTAYLELWRLNRLCLASNSVISIDQIWLDNDRIRFILCMLTSLICMHPWSFSGW